MSEWQPIETAPKDGTWILLCAPPEEHCRDAWQMCVATWERLGYNSGPQWAYGANHEHSFRDGVYGATHWMPLPKPPGDDRPSRREAAGTMTAETARERARQIMPSMRANLLRTGGEASGAVEVVLADALLQVQARERERCAGIADAHATCEGIAQKIAAEIRRLPER